MFTGMSNLLVTMAHEVYLNFDKNVDFKPVSGDLPLVEKDGHISLRLGTLQHGQTKDVVMPVNIGNLPESAWSHPYIVANVQYETCCSDAVPLFAETSEVTA